MTTEELKQLVLEHLRMRQECRQPSHLTFGEICLGIKDVIAQRHRKEAEHQSGERFLGESDDPRLMHVVWDLILERVLIPGSNIQPQTHRDGWPHLSLTEHGLKVVAEGRPVPYDPDGYLSRLKDDCPRLHPTVLRYIEESVATFRTGNYLASVVMLGAASEQLFADLCETITAAISDQAKQKKFRDKVNSRKMKDQVNAVIGWCRNHKSDLEGEWAGDEQVEVVDKVADIIRKRRNDAGHPKDPPAIPSHEQMYSFLMVFPEYCKSLHELKTYLDGKQGAIA